MLKEDFLKAKWDSVGLLMQSKNGKTNIYIEGKDDYFFYYQFFKNSNPNMIRCNKKSNVLKVAKLFNKIGDNQSIFFVDKDFDENEHIENVYVTEYYNFESHIFSRENIKQYLLERHSVPEEDTNKLIDFLNSPEVISIFHSEFERIKMHDGNSTNKLIPNQLNIIDVDSTYNFSVENLFPQRVMPAIQTEPFDNVEMYNGKFVGNLIFGILNRAWFKQKLREDMQKINRKELTSDMIIFTKLPDYIRNSQIII